MALSLRRRCSPVHTTRVRRPPQSRALVPDVVSPSHPEHRVTGSIWPCPPPRAITRRRTRCQSHGRGEERAPQLTRTDPSRTAHPQQLHAPAEPERSRRVQAEPAAGPGRNRTASRQGPEPAAAAEAAEQGNWAYWYVAGLCLTVSHNVNTTPLQCAPNLFNLLLIHTTNANATVDLAVNVLNNFELKRDTIQTKNDFPTQ